MAITITISDTSDTQTFTLIVSPLVQTPILAETDVTTIDNNISTYYTGSKRRFTVDFGYMNALDYALLKGFYDRQYTNLKYPTITISGADNISNTPLVAKMILNEQKIIDNCGNVENVSVVFRESKQML